MQQRNTMESVAPALMPADVDALRAGFRGRLILPGDGAYEERRRVWNGTVDKRPALIAECSGTTDVIAALGFARGKSLPVSVRGGGHNVAGTAIAEGGVVLDLSPMRGVRVDPVARTVRAGGGALLGDIDHETQAFGLATPAGVVSRTGIAGLSLHGGLGFLTRRLGLTCDNLLAADVVTADGKLVVANEKENSDLLWALRGGGGNFGVVTSFEFRLHPVGPEVFMGLVMYPASEARQVLRVFRDFMAKAPDELMAVAIFWNTPREEPLPEAARNQQTIVVGACWSGPMAEAEKVVKPLREIATPYVDLSGPMPFEVAQKLFDPEYPDGRRYYWKSAYLDALDEGTIGDLIELGTTRPSSLSSLDIWCLGGAAARVPASHSAFAGRSHPFLLGAEANWNDPAEDAANIAWARSCVERAERRFKGTGAYLNFPGSAEEASAGIERSYGENIARLRAVKAKYDPDNVFRSNFNITPAAGQ